MSTTKPDLRSALVRAALLDLQSRSFYLSDLWSNLTDELGGAQSLDIGEFTDDFEVEDIVDDNQVDTTFTVSIPTYGNNQLVVNKRVGLARKIPSFDEQFTMTGAYVARLTDHMFRSMRNDRDTKDLRDLLRNYVDDDDYNVNPAGDPLTREMVGEVIARAMDTDGADPAQLAWMVNTYMSESIKLLPGWVANMEAMNGRIGIGRIGFLNDIPVYTSQTVQRLTVAALGVTVAGGDAVFAIPAANRPHGFRVGEKIWTTETSGGTTWDAGAGDDIPESVPLPISAVAAGTITVPYAGTGATDAAANITITMATLPNLLVRRDWLWQATVRPGVKSRIVDSGNDDPTDTLQVSSMYGCKSRTGAVHVLHVPKRVAVG